MERRTDRTGARRRRYRSIAMIIVVVLLASLASCAADANDLVKTPNEEGVTAGFWRGLWHGFISLFTFIISLFSDKVGVYEIHNSGGWYNLGFILGVSAFYGGGSGAGTKGSSRRRR